MGIVSHFLKARGSNPHSLDPKSSALPIKLAFNYCYFLNVRVLKLEFNFDEYRAQYASE